MAGTVIYTCTRCGGKNTAPVWEALGIGELEEKCPTCGKWTKLVAPALQPKLVFGQRPEKAA